MGKKITISVRSLVAYTLLIAIVVSIFQFAPVSEAGVETFNITNQERTITAGQSFQIKLNGIKASKVKWKSNNTSVATVSKKGIVKGVKKGKTVIKGTYNSLVFNVTVIVNPKNKNTLVDGETTYKINKPKMITSYDNRLQLRLSGTFTNNGSTPIHFLGLYRYIIYVSGVYTAGNEYNTGTPIKDGASIECTCDIDVVKGDKVEIELIREHYNEKTREITDEVVYSTVYIVK